MKSIVIEVKDKDAILLCDDGQFVTTNRRDYAIGDVIMTNTNPIKKHVLAMAATAAAFVLLFSAGIYAYMSPYYYVSVDVNPSIVMKANRFERVIGMEAMNDDAKAVLSEINWKNKTVEQVMNETLLEIEQEGYFEQSDEILIAATSKNGKNADKLAMALSKTAKFANKEHAEISSEAIGYEMVQSAKALGMTPGKYNLITKHLGESVNADNVDEYLNTSVKDLMARFTATKGLNGKKTAAEAKAENGNADIDAKSDKKAEKKQFAEQKSAEASQRATEQRQEAEQNASEATQAVTEQQQQAEQKASEATQAATEQRQEAEQSATQATQAATEQRQEAEQFATEATQSAMEQRQEYGRS